MGGERGDGKGKGGRGEMGKGDREGKGGGGDGEETNGKRIIICSAHAHTVATQQDGVTRSRAVCTTRHVKDHDSHGPIYILWLRVEV